MSSSSSKKTLKKYTPIPKSKDYEINTPNCDITILKKKQDDIKENLKRINKIQKKCQNRYINEEYRKSMTLRELLKIIKKENKTNVRDLLELFPVLGTGNQTTVNTVFEALWVLVFLYRLDDFDSKYPGDMDRIFYNFKSGQPKTSNNILDGNVNGGNKEGIVDIFFKMSPINNTPIQENNKSKTPCNGDYVSYPYCIGESQKTYNNYFCSVKYYLKEKGYGKYDIQDIYAESMQKDANILLLVNDQTKMGKTNKNIKNLVAGIYDTVYLDKLYKTLLYKLKNKEIIPENDDTIDGSSLLQPRFHQKYFIDYTIESIKKKSKNFVWGAVPRSGKSFMIGGLIAEEQPKYVFIFLGAITETKGQFIEMFEKYSDFKDYEIYDVQSKTYSKRGYGSEKKIIIYSQEWARMKNKNTNLPQKLLKILKKEKDKLIFFDEIHQGSSGKMQEGMLDEMVFKNEYKAFIMVTATFAKPYIKYLNKSDIPIKLINWSYKDIQDMKSINTVIINKNFDDNIYFINLNKMIENIKKEEDGIVKSNIFNKLIKDYIDIGGSLNQLSEEYDIYPELVVATLNKNNSEKKYDDIIVNGNINVDDIFRPLMQKQNIDKINTSPCETLIKYIWNELYTKFLYTNKIDIKKPHSQLWFLPTTLRNKNTGESDDIEDDIGRFSYMCKHLTQLLMNGKTGISKLFREHFCVIILHSVGFDNTQIDFLEAKKIDKNVNWNNAIVDNTSKGYGCVSTTCRKSDIGVKECILAQEACAKEHGKSVIILTGKMLRLGISLPCVDVALHFDPISSVDTIYQSMFRVLTERKGKDKGIFIDMNQDRNVKFMYDLFSYQNPEKDEGEDEDKSIKKRMEDFEDFLLLYDYNGINVLKNDNYRNMYDRILEQFDLDNKEEFIKKLEINNIQNLFDGDINQKIIDPFYSILEKYKIIYNEKPKRGDINIKYKQSEVELFMKDFITLFILFYSDNINEINKENIKDKLDEFFKSKISDIVETCENMNIKNVLDCHFYNLIRSENDKLNKQQINDKFGKLKDDIKKIFDFIISNSQFFNIYDISLQMINNIKDSIKIMGEKESCSTDFIDSNVLSIIRDRLTVRKEEKNLYGEVFTPIELVCEMLNKIPDEVWKNPNLKWLDPANGIGNFPVVVYYKLMESLKDEIPADTQRSRHIIENMVYMVELNQVNSKVCEKIFHMIDPKSKPNIITGSFIGPKEDYKKIIDFDFKFDVIFGNPPYNSGGIQSKKGTKVGKKTIWPLFFDKSLEYLNDNMYLCFITPGSWVSLQSDSQRFLDNQILYIKFYNIRKAPTIFGKVSGEIPLTYYLLQKSNTKNDTQIYDNCLNKFLLFNIYDNNFIPVEIIGIIKKMINLTIKYGSLETYYSNTRFSTTSNITNIPTKDNIYPIVEISYEKINIKYYDINNNFIGKSKKYLTNKKLLFPNYSMGYPILDKSGYLYPKSQGNKYIIDYNNDEKVLKNIQNLFYTDVVLYLINTLKTKQNFFQNQIFRILPDIGKMDIPIITNENIYDIFGLDEEDKICINKFKQTGEGRLTPEKIQEFKDFDLQKYYPEIKNIDNLIKIKYESSYKNGYNDGYNNIKYDIKNNDPIGYDDGYGEGRVEQESGKVISNKIKNKTIKK
jgi:superfamily II DNA or RNA helicase